jgi:Fe-S-cluster containining protein
VNEKELELIYGKRPTLDERKEWGIKRSTPKGMSAIESKLPCRQFDPVTRTCQIYQHRPGSCKDFPFLVEQDALIIKPGCPFSTSDPEYKKLVEITSRHGKVIVKKN